MNILTPAKRRALKARAHALHPVVMIGDAGLTPAVLREIDLNLASHELIKIRVLGDDRQARAAMVDAICAAAGAQPVQRIGKMLVVYRPRPAESPEKDGVKAPARRRAARKAPRRTKRSFQM